MTQQDVSLPESAPQVAFVSDDCVRILRFAAESLDQGYGAALITLVEVHGGAARAVGSHMAVRSDGLHCGYVSGGCTEAAVATEAVEAIARGADRYLLIGENSPFFDVVLPCGGAIRLSIHVLQDSRPLWTVIDGLEMRQRCSLRYDPRAQSLTAAPLVPVQGWFEGSFIIAYRPRTKVLLCGASIELEVTTALARAVGYSVIAFLSATDERNITSAQIDEDTAVAVLHHDLEREMPILQAALAAKPFYIGCLGNSRTHGRRTDALIMLGYSEADIGRIKAPIGIFGKARDAGSLALSALADISAARRA